MVTRKPLKKHKVSSKTGRVTEKTAQRVPNDGQVLKNLANQKLAAELRIRGASYQQIAEHMNMDVRSVKRLVQRSLEEYHDSHIEVVQEYLALNLARSDQLMRVWLPKALGGTRKEKIADPVTGQITEVQTTMEPDPQAAKIVLDAMRDIGRLLGTGNANRIELTGAAGGPIVTAAVDAMDAARLVREAFGGAAAKSLPVGDANGGTVKPS